jgi:hypothetical protein
MDTIRRLNNRLQACGIDTAGYNIVVDDLSQVYNEDRIHIEGSFYVNDNPRNDVMIRVYKHIKNNRHDITEKLETLEKFVDLLFAGREILNPQDFEVVHEPRVPLDELNKMLMMLELTYPNITKESG